MTKTKTNAIATKTKQVALTNPNDIMEFATSLKSLITDNNLCTNIKGKDYVNVEGWQIAGAFTGTFPIVESVEAMPTTRPGEYKYRAEVSLHDKDDRLVGKGVAICSNKEVGKGGFDEYAVASMAQTRAVGKAFRMKIGWLLKVAGYETTPAEEMDPVVDKSPEAKVVDEPETEKPTRREISYAIDSIEQAKSLKDLRIFYTTLGSLKDNPEIKSKIDEMRVKFGQTIQEGATNETAE